nr:MAG TPA: hypothetical protein [Crassvirales sp.]
MFLSIHYFLFSTSIYKYPIKRKIRNICIILVFIFCNRIKINTYFFTIFYSTNL